MSRHADRIRCADQTKKYQHSYILLSVTIKPETMKKILIIIGHLLIIASGTLFAVIVSYLMQ